MTADLCRTSCLSRGQAVLGSPTRIAKLATVSVHGGMAPLTAAKVATAIGAATSNHHQAPLSRPRVTPVRSGLWSMAMPAG